MRRVILQMMITVDGYLSGPNNELDWMISPDKDRERNHLALLDTVDTALIGRGVYDEMSRYWPTASGEIAEKVNAIKKLVFTETPEEFTWKNATSFLTDDDLASKVEQLKSQNGKDMVLYGGVGLAQSFARYNLVDEYQLTVYPVALGKGKPLFGELEGRLDLELLGVEAYASGAMMLRYKPA